MYQNEAGTQPFISESVLKGVGCKKVEDVVPDIELHVGPDEQTVERLSVALPLPVGALWPHQVGRLFGLLAPVEAAILAFVVDGTTCTVK